MRRPEQFSRPLTPLEVGALLVALSLILAACCGCLAWSWLVPAPPPQVPHPVPTETFERSTR